MPECPAAGAEVEDRKSSIAATGTLQFFRLRLSVPCKPRSAPQRSTDDTLRHLPLYILLLSFVFVCDLANFVFEAKS